MYTNHKTRVKQSGLILLLLWTLPVVSSAQSIQWSISAGPSYHIQEFETPLPWWETAGLLFPSVMLHAEIPMRFIEGPLGEKLFFSTGIRYVRLASRVDWRFEVSNNNDVFTGKFKISQHYLATPLQFRLNMGKSPVFLLGGPELGVLFSAKKKSDTLTPEEFSSSQTESVGKDLHRLNISLYGGAGLRLNNQLRIYARYGVGLRNTKKDAERAVLDSDWRSREIEFAVEFIL